MSLLLLSRMNLCCVIFSKGPFTYLIFDAIYRAIPNQLRFHGDLTAISAISRRQIAAVSNLLEF